MYIERKKEEKIRNSEKINELTKKEKINEKGNIGEGKMEGQKVRIKDRRKVRRKKGKK